MDIIQKTTLKLEILVSTMDRISLDFLDVMFKNVDTSKFSILIVNQTTPNRILKSGVSNVRVINSFERGLSKSRNLAIQNAQADIVLISDDDVIYEKEFYQSVIEAFISTPNACLISFMANNYDKKELYRGYSKDSRVHDLKSIKDIISWEIAFNLNKILNLGISFNEKFGLGAQFETAEEYLFTRDVLKAGGFCYFSNALIVSHPDFNSGKDSGSDRQVFARAALHYKIYKRIAYIWLLKYLFFLLRNNYIKFTEFSAKWKVGLNGIETYKELSN